MSFDLIPRSFLNLPNRLPSIFDDEDTLASFLPASGLTVSEDDESVFVEAAMPGLNAGDVEVTFDKGALWIRGSREEQQNEDKKKKFYRKASSSFSYRIMVPGKIDENQEPDAVYKNGIMKVTFNKIPEKEPRRLAVRTE